jgi:hypothetical protein
LAALPGFVLLLAVYGFVRLLQPVFRSEEGFLAIRKVRTDVPHTGLVSAEKVYVPAEG